MKHIFENHDLVTTRCGEFIDMTDDVLDAVERSEVVNGMATVYSPHTTCAIVVNERESGFFQDFCELMDELVPRGDVYYRHDDLEIRTEGLEDDPHEFPNGHSHCRAVLMSPSQTIPIVDGQLRLGKYQKVFFCELDRGKERKVFIQVLGE
jgi:secondary thiamine-phosphate synthase enzyme